MNFAEAAEAVGAVAQAEPAKLIGPIGPPLGQPQAAFASVGPQRA